MSWGMKSAAGCVLLFCLGCGSGAAESIDRSSDWTKSENGGETSEELAARKADALLVQRTVARERLLQELDELDYLELSRPARPFPRSRVEELGFEPRATEIAQKVRIALTTENRVQEIIAATGAVYPLALLSGRNLRDGRISPLPTGGSSFHPQQVSLASTPPLDVEVSQYVPHDAQSFRADVLDGIRGAKITPAENVSQSIEITYSAGQIESTLGTKLGFLDFSGIAEFASAASATQPLHCLIRRETHFLLEPAQKPVLKDWLTEQVESGLAAAWLRDLPVYVNQVQFGKLVLILGLVPTDPERAKIAMNEAFLIKDGNLAPEQQEMLHGSRFRLFVHGGDRGHTNGPVEYDASGPAAFEEFRRQTLIDLAPSPSVRNSEAVGFTVESLELNPRTIALICASHAVFEKDVPRPYEVYIRPVGIRIGQAGDAPDHRHGDFHAAVKLGGQIVQSGHLAVRIPGGRADRTPVQIDISADRIRGPFRVESRLGELAAMLGESDSGPDAGEIVGWPEGFNDDEGKPGSRARRWDQTVSIINEKVPFDLGEILETGNEVQAEQHKLRARTFTIERNVAPAGDGRKNAFTFEILVAVPRGLTERKKEQLLRD